MKKNILQQNHLTSQTGSGKGPEFVLHKLLHKTKISQERFGFGLCDDLPCGAKKKKRPWQYLIL